MHIIKCIYYATLFILMHKYSLLFYTYLVASVNFFVMVLWYGYDFRKTYCYCQAYCGKFMKLWILVSDMFDSF